MVPPSARSSPPTPLQSLLRSHRQPDLYRRLHYRASCGLTRADLHRRLHYRASCGPNIVAPAAPRTTLDTVVTWLVGGWFKISVWICVYITSIKMYIYIHIRHGLRELHQLQHGCLLCLETAKACHAYNHDDCVQQCDVSMHCSPPCRSNQII